MFWFNFDSWNLLWCHFCAPVFPIYIIFPSWRRYTKCFSPGGILFLLSVIFLNHHTYQNEKSLLICLPSAKINGYIFEWTWNRFCLFFFKFNNIFVSTFKQKQLKILLNEKQFECVTHNIMKILSNEYL